MRNFAAILFGSLFGIGVLLLWQSLWPSEDTIPTIESASRKNSASNFHDQKNSRQFGDGSNLTNADKAQIRELRLAGELNRLQGEIHALEDKLHPEGESDDGTELEAVDEQSVLERIENLRDTQITAFSQENRNPKWAAAAEKEFTHDFGRMLSTTGSSARFNSVECRSSRCLATVTWPTFEQAANEQRSFAHATMSQNCRIMSYMPPSVSNPKAEYQHKIIFKCNPGQAKDMDDPT